ncbi:MAG: HipA N-terminal domain-containing protein, partial [Proteiniphilum sp.]
MMNTAIVRIWGKMAGAVAWDEKSGLASFEYDPTFKRLGWELSPLKMPLSPEQQIYSFPELREETGSSFDTFKGLPGLLADMLPDRYGNELINLWLARQGRAENSMNPVEMLCFIGTRGMGALEIEPAILKHNVNTFPVEIDSLVEIAGKMLSQKKAFVADLKSD